MAGFLKTFFSRKQRKAHSAESVHRIDAGAQGAPTAETSQPSTGQLLSSGLPADLDLQFSTWVIGANSSAETSLSNDERQLLASVESVMRPDAADSDLLPRVPAVVPRLLQSLRDENVTATKISQEITQDPTLVGEVIRVANGPYYRTVIPTTILDQALVKLGHDGLRQVIASIAFRSIIDARTGHYLRLGAPLLWKQTENSAYAARYLAAREGADIFEAYLAALVQNIGATVALKVLDNHLDNGDAPHSIAFHQAIGLLTQKLTLYIVSSWNFPPSLVEALEEQINIDSAKTVSPLGAVIYAADRLSKLFMLVESTRIEVDLDQIFNDAEADSQKSCAQCFKELTALAEEPD